MVHVHRDHKKGPLAGSAHPAGEYYELASANGGLGGKLIGAGGGGFLMFYTEDTRPLRHEMAQAGLREVRFHFDFEGTRC